MVLYKKVNGKQVELSKKEEKEVRKEWAEAEKEQKANAWLVGRRSEYPDPRDQLGMIYNSMDKDEMPGKGCDWYNMCKAVKEKYPKPKE